VIFDVNDSTLTNQYTVVGLFFVQERLLHELYRNLFRKGDDVKRKKNRLKELRERRTATYHELADELERCY
jgi:hypothetical protein